MKNRSKPTVINLRLKTCPIQAVRFRGIVLQKSTPDVFIVHPLHTQMNMQITVNIPVQFISYMVSITAWRDIFSFCCVGRRIRRFFFCFLCISFRFRNGLGGNPRFFFLESIVNVRLGNRPLG